MMQGAETKQDAGILRKLVTIGLLVIVLIAPTQYSFEVRDKTYLSIVDPLLWLVCLLWLVDLVKSRTLLSVKPPPLVTILFVVAAFLSIAKAGNRFASLKDIFQILEYFAVAFLLFTSVIKDCRQLKMVLYGFLGTATAVVGLGLLQYLSSGTETFMVGSTFGNRNVLGGYLSLVLPLMFGLMLFESRWSRRIWYALTIMAGAVVTLSGGTAIALVLSLCIVSVLKSQRAFVMLLVVLSLGMATVLSHLPRENGRALRESISMFDDEGELSKRYPEWQAGVAMIREHPLLGVGIGNYQANIGLHYGTVPNRPVAAEADSQNMYLVLASSMGLPGLACFLGMLFLFARNAVRSYFDSGSSQIQRGLALGLLGSLIAFSINCIWSPLLVRGIGIPLALVFSLTIVLERMRNH